MLPRKGALASEKHARVRGRSYGTGRRQGCSSRVHLSPAFNRAESQLRGRNAARRSRTPLRVRADRKQKLLRIVADTGYNSIKLWERLKRRRYSPDCARIVPPRSSPLSRWPAASAVTAAAGSSSALTPGCTTFRHLVTRYDNKDRSTTGLSSVRGVQRLRYASFKTTQWTPSRIRHPWPSSLSADDVVGQVSHPGMCGSWRS